MKTALLVIDVQRVLFEGDLKPFAADEVVHNINLVTDKARKSCVPVVFIQHEQADSVIEYGSEGWQLQSDLKTYETDTFVRKTTPDSFLRTNLQEFLESISNLAVCGYASEFCVDTTTRRAAGLGYSVQLIADAHTTHDKEHATGEQIWMHHNATLLNISSFGVPITSVSASDVEF
ncbi:cysteine hydrolase family protein [Photobacterium leiognathi]|uniref:cysteine hydrolase family protein n=1 Tax=Photobacterium leiognathi TaxID=553611 RepID=UPI00273899D5|nr:cysteine hydrolase family protein [Photobacterium leiognathi]